MAIITTGSHPKHLWPGVYAFFGIAYESHGIEYPDLVDVRDSSKNYEEMVQNTGFGLAPQKGQGLSVSLRRGLARVHRALHAHHLRPRLHHHPGGSRGQPLRVRVDGPRAVAQDLHGRDEGERGREHVQPRLQLLLHRRRRRVHVQRIASDASGNQSNVLATASDFLGSLLRGHDRADHGRDERPRHQDQAHAAVAARAAADVVRGEPRAAVGAAERHGEQRGQRAAATNALPKGIKVNHYFTDTDAWFIRTNAPKGPTLFQRRSLEFTKDNEFSTENAMAKATERYSVYWGDWRGSTARRARNE
jgi:hypothetical protein